MTDNRPAEHPIGERMKELQALHSLSELTKREGITLDELYQELANILPQSWQYPEIAYVMIVIGDREFCTENFAISPWRQSAPVKVHGSVVGGVDVGYLKEKPEQDEGPFLKEERLLLNAIAERLGHITEHKQAEEALRESKELAVTKQSEDAAREYAESIVDTVREPLIILDADLRVVSASRSFYRIFRVVPEETVGQLIYDLGNKQWDIPKLRELLEKVLPEKTIFENMEIEHDFPGIGQKWMALNARQVTGTSGQAQLILLAIEDITERKQAEEVIRKLNTELEQRAAELEDAVKELEAFSYSVSHDLQTPLRAIDGFSRLLLTTTAGHLDGEQERLLQVIRSSTQQMGQLIADLLAFARLGRQELRKSKVDMEKLAQAVFAELRTANPGRPLELVMDAISPALGDPSMLHQVWFNLLSNAVKFTRGRDPARIKIGSQTEGGMNRYSVRDNGVGFDMRYADKLFGVFQRLHSTREFEGTGVGLAIVQRVIHRLGGKVQADGTVGEGATFAFTLPKGE